MELTIKSLVSISQKNKGVRKMEKSLCDRLFSSIIMEVSAYGALSWFVYGMLAQLAVWPGGYTSYCHSIAIFCVFYWYYPGRYRTIFGPDRASCLQLLYLPGTWHPRYDLCFIPILWSRSAITDGFTI